MSYDRAIKRTFVVREVRATVTQGLPSSPPRGEVNVESASFVEDTEREAN
jgi:hypothetical protein